MRLKTVTLVVLSLLVLPFIRGQRVEASPGTGLRIVDASDVTKTTPVVNEGGKLQLKVVDGSGNAVAVQSWSTDNKSVGKVNRKKGRLTGKAFGFATITAHTSQGDVSGFIVVARVRRQTGAMTQGDTKTDTSGNVYLSSPTRHVLYRASGLSAEVFAGHTDQSGYQDGTGDGIRFNGPAGIGVDNRAEGGLYIADTMNSVIRKVDFRERSSLAAGVPGFAGTMHGDENPLADAVFDAPRGVASVGSNFYVTDTNNHSVWYVDVQRQVVELVAGEPGEAGNANGQGRQARFDHPSGITINTRGNLLAVADTGNNIVRLIAIAPRQGGGVIGNVTTLGLSSSSRNADILAKLDADRGSDQIVFDQPISVSFDGVDNVYVIDNQTASVVTRPTAASGRPVDRVDLAQVGTLGDPASVSVRRTQAFVLDEAATSESSAVNVVEIGAPTITSLSDDTDEITGGRQITVTGTNFAPESQVALGDAEVSDLTILSSTRLQFVVPPQQTAGMKTLTVLTRGGTAQVPFRIRLKTIAELANGEITTVVSPVPYAGDGLLATNPRGRFISATLTIDASGNIYFPDAINHRIRRIDASTGIITTVAGTGTQGFSGDGGLAIAATLRGPRGVRVDSAGNLLITDTNNNRVRRLDAVTGIITTIVGTGTAGFGGDGGPAVDAQLSRPFDLGIDAAGNLFITDQANFRIRRVDTAGTITTVAGNGTDGDSGDGGPAVDAALGLIVNAVAIDANDNLFISDPIHHRIRRVDATSGVIDAFAGSGDSTFGGDGGPATGAGIPGPNGLAFDREGNLYVADDQSSRIRRIDVQSGVITTVAGNGTAGFGGDGGQAVNASLNYPSDVLVDGAGNILIGDTYNNRIRRVDAISQVIVTIAGDDPFLGDGGPAIDAVLFQPQSLVVNETGDLFIADSGDGRIRRVDAQSGIVSTVAGNGEPSYTGGGRRATKTGLGYPFGVAVDSDDNIFIAGDDSQRILRVDAASRILTCIAGNGVYDPSSGFGTFSGDGGPAVNAGLNLPLGVAVDNAGNVFVADTYNNRIRRIDASGVITTVVGDGAPPGEEGGGYFGDGGPAVSAGLKIPYAIAFDSAGNLYVADSGNGCIRRVDAVSGIITTIAGSGLSDDLGDGGLAVDAVLDFPSGIAFDGAGNLFIADRVGARVRRVDAVTGIITTVAGTGVHSYSGDGGPAVMATLGRPCSVAVDRNGTLFICDSGTNALRAVKGVAVGVKSTNDEPPVARREFTEVRRRRVWRG